MFYSFQSDRTKIGGVTLTFWESSGSISWNLVSWIRGGHEIVFHMRIYVAVHAWADSCEVFSSLLWTDHTISFAQAARPVVMKGPTLTWICETDYAIPLWTWISYPILICCINPPWRQIRFPSWFSQWQSTKYSFVVRRSHACCFTGHSTF